MRGLLLVALLPLAACGGGGTAISINASDADGNVTVGTDANGQLAIDTPVFKGKLTLPRMKLDASDFDMNGVHLYPGSKIVGMDVDAHDRPGDADDGRVRVRFDSPATAGTVRTWFRDKLTAAGFSVADDGAGLSGETDDAKPFKLELTPDGADTAKGTITIG